MSDYREDRRGQLERKEMRSAFNNRVEVYYVCRKCMSVAVGDPPKCLRCERRYAPKHTPEEEQAMSEQMEAIVKEYNQLTGKKVKRFASVAIGQTRLEKARFEQENPPAPKPPKVKAEKPKKAPKIKAETNGKGSHESMSKAVTKSWDDETVAKRRGERHTAHVEGHGEWKSVHQAFKALGLPTGRCIPFRRQLKQEGQLTFKHNGKDYVFSVKVREPQKKVKEEAAAS